MLTLGTAEAEFIGLNIGAQTNRAAFASHTGNTSSSIDLVDDVGVEGGEQSSMMLILEHPITALPNIRYQGYKLDSSDRSSLHPGGNFNGGAFSAGKGSTPSFDLAHDDVVLYYQLLNSRVNLDMGVDLKRFDGRLTAGDTVAGEIDVDETIPLMHLSARVALPINGLYVGADLNANLVDLGISESSAQDSTIKMGYDSGNGLGIEGGIKSYSLELNDPDDAGTDLEYDGLFLNGYYNF